MDPNMHHLRGGTSRRGFLTSGIAFAAAGAALNPSAAFAQEKRAGVFNQPLPTPFVYLSQLAAATNVPLIASWVSTLRITPFFNGDVVLAAASMNRAIDIVQELTLAGLPNIAMNFCRRSQDAQFYFPIVLLNVPAGAPMQSYMLSMGIPPGELTPALTPNAMQALEARDTESGLTNLTFAGLQSLRSQIPAIVALQPEVGAAFVFGAALSGAAITTPASVLGNSLGFFGFTSIGASRSLLP